MRASTVFAILLLAVLAFGFVPSQVHAAAPTNVQIAANNSSGITYGTNLNFNDNIFADKVQSLSNEINFTNIAYSASSNPTQAFGVAQCCSSTGISNALNDIKGDHVEFIETFTSGNPNLYFYYIMPAGSASTIPQSVVYTQGSLQAVIQQAQYQTTATCNSPPCVYQNASNKTLILISGNISPVTVDFYFPPFGNGQSCGIINFVACGSSSGSGAVVGGVVTTTTVVAQSQSSSSGGGGGGGGGSCPVGWYRMNGQCIQVSVGTTTMTNTNTTENGNLYTQNPYGLGTVAIVLVIGLSVLLGAVSRLPRKDNPFREPASGQGGFHRPSASHDANFHKPKNGGGGFHRPARSGGEFHRPEGGGGAFHKPSSSKSRWRKPKS